MFDGAFGTTPTLALTMQANLDHMFALWGILKRLVLRSMSVL